VGFPVVPRRTGMARHLRDEPPRKG
jgi:hypothetical protein